MGMFSEIHASIEAEGLEKALLNAISLGNKEIDSYCRENILPLYKNAVNETFGDPSDNYNTIMDYFVNK